MGKVSYRSVDVDGLNVFYRESGPQDGPIVLLLHGFPSAGHMFRDLIPLLADRYRVIAPTCRASASPTCPAATSSTTPSTTSPA